MSFISKTPKPPYYAVVFTSINADVDHTEHTTMYKRIIEVAQRYEGYLGIEPARNPDGTGVAAVYWKDHDSILAFARDPEHRIAEEGPRDLVQPLLHSHLQGGARLRPTRGMIRIASMTS